MLITPQIPSNCPECTIGDFAFGTFIPIDADSMYCHVCTMLTVLTDEEEEPEIKASLNICPHCKVADSFAIAGDEVYCEGCGFDPDEEVESQEIAFLWTLGSQIRGFLERGLAQPGSKLGTFIRSDCGPSCPFQASCPQTYGNFAKCFKEYSGSDGSEMSKRSKKQRKRQLKLQNLQKKSRGMVACSSIGWFRRRWSDREITNYGIENNSSQQSRDTKRG